MPRKLDNKNIDDAVESGWTVIESCDNVDLISKAFYEDSER